MVKKSHRHNRKFRLQAEPIIEVPQSTKETKETKPIKIKKWRDYTWPIILSITGFIASTYGGNVLNNISPIGGFYSFYIVRMYYIGLLDLGTNQ
jgi:hypothetical protein